MKLYSIASFGTTIARASIKCVSSVRVQRSLTVRASGNDVSGRLKVDMKEAMKAKNQSRLDTIRFLQAAIKTKEIELRETAQVISDDDVIKVIQKLQKQRQDSIESYRQGGREDLVGKEQEELDVYSSYMPTMMTREELQVVVDEVMAEAGATSIKQMGAVMKGVQLRVGALGDSKTISEMIKAKLK